MRREDAIKLFENHSHAAKCLGVSRTTLYKWPEVITRAQENMVRGAYAQYVEERDREVVHILEAS